MAVREYGYLFFLVDSHSRPMVHLVDFEPEKDENGKPIPGGEPYRCSCESFRLRVDRPCRHCVEVFEYLLPIVQHLAHWRKKAKPAAPAKPQRQKRIYNLPANKS